MKTESKNRQPAILVVDDELLIRDLLFDFFSSQGFTVYPAESGSEAIKMIDLADFQVALVDLKMPEMDGLELTAELQRRKPHVPVIMMTAYPTPESVAETINIGLFDFIVKPFKIVDLFEIIKRAGDEYGTRTKSGCAPAATKTK